MAGKKTRPPRTSKEWLAKLPQFEPDYSIPYHQIDFEDGEHIIFPPQREEKIKSALTQLINGQAGSGCWENKPIGIDRFVKNAMLAIATFEYRRSRVAAFDRQIAKATLRSSVDRISDTVRALERIAANRELAHFLEDVFVTHMKAEHRSASRSQKPSARALTSALRRASRWLEMYHEISPGRMAAQLMRLEPILSVAAERVEFQSGDFQRDEIAQELCNDLAFAWISGTGRLPTFSKPNPRLKNRSAFAELLLLVNNSILNPLYRHDADFRSHGIKACDQMRNRFPDLAASRRPPRRT